MISKTRPAGSIGLAHNNEDDGGRGWCMAMMMTMGKRLVHNDEEGGAGA